jgi:DNA-binding protein HU-beta
VAEIKEAVGMKKVDLMGLTAQRTGKPVEDVRSIVDAFLGALGETLVNGESIQFRGFGTFSVHETPARPGFNPRTGEQVQIPAHLQVKFRAGKGMKRGLGLTGYKWRQSAC